MDHAYRFPVDLAMLQMLSDSQESIPIDHTDPKTS